MTSAQPGGVSQGSVLCYSGKMMVDCFCPGFRRCYRSSFVSVVIREVLLFLSVTFEWRVKRPKARAEMVRETVPLNNNRNGTKEFDRADTRKQMKGNSTVH